MPNHTQVSSVSQISRRLNLPLHRACYVVRTRGIQPVAWAGHARLFDEDGVEKIAAAVQEMDRGESQANTLKKVRPTARSHGASHVS